MAEANPEFGKVNLASAATWTPAVVVAAIGYLKVNVPGFIPEKVDFLPATGTVFLMYLLLMRADRRAERAEATKDRVVAEAAPVIAAALAVLPKHGEEA